MTRAIVKAYSQHNGSLSQFYNDVAKIKFPKYSKPEIERILLRLPNFYLHQNPSKITHIDTVRVWQPGSIAIDIAFFRDTIIYVAIDQFSRFIFAKRYANKNTESSLAFVEHVNKGMQRFGYLITAYASDMEKSLLSRKVQQYARSRAQAYFLQTQNVHNSSVESAIRLLKRFLAKNADSSRKVNARVLSSALDQLNAMKRRVLAGYSAVDIMNKVRGSWRKVQIVTKTAYEKKRAKMFSRVWKVGTRVRVRPFANVYGRKGDKGFWTDKAEFYIHKVLRGRAQLAYKLKQKIGKKKYDHISSIFYPNELIPVHVPRSM